jgi:hypothetical protein
MVLMRQKMGCIYFGLFCHQTHLVTLFLGADFQPIMLTIKRLRQKNKQEQAFALRLSEACSL